MTFHRSLPATTLPALPGLLRSAGALLPGVALCIAVSAASWLLAVGEHRLFGRAWVETLVLAILVGTAVRTVWAPGPRWLPGIRFSAATLLETAVVLLGAAVSATTVLAAGPVLLVGIAATVAIAIAASYTIGRALGLPPRMATLVACGNSICGNSAIAAVAPVIGASAQEVASSIAFTAILGVAVVLGLPLLIGVLSLGELQYGVLAGLTVYAVPQVLAATAPVGALAVQAGTLVKLVRVLMLGPVVLGLSLFAGRLHDGPPDDASPIAAGEAGTPRHPPLHKLVPWFIVGFLGLMLARALGLVPHVALAPIGHTATVLTILSMAALGLGVDVRVAARAGGRVTLAVTASLVVLGAISFGLIRLLGVG
jgi:uncharacterized integral membrane protein (TIGR00698 family)